MLPIHNILHPTDFSSRSQHAFEFACALARDYGARLVVAHVAAPPTILFGEGVVPPESELMHREAKAQLQRLEVPHANIRAERRFVEGDAVAEILRLAKELPADVIVMGTHGRGALARLVMGSVAEHVMRKASCPVLTVAAPFVHDEAHHAKDDKHIGAAEKRGSVMRVSEVMTQGAECTRPNASLEEAAQRMKALDVGALPVCDNDRLVGMITDRDITVRATAGACDPSSTCVREVMTPDIVYCFDDQLISEATMLMEDNQIRRLPVLNRSKRLVGIVSLGDIAVKSGDDQLTGAALEQVSEPALPTR